ncbi:MAG: DUF397 domain-containing protein [Mycobacteriales bacterium]|jgi:hypothetical protein
MADSSIARPRWRKSTRSFDDTACVEVALADTGVLVRHSRRRSGAVLSFSPEEWRAFVAGVKACEFDLP